jgi:Zn-dependent protease
MRTSITIGTIAGIPIQIHFNWIVIAVLLTWSLAGGYFPQKFPGWRAADYWIFGALTALLFFCSVLLHELGHGLAAIQEHVPVRSITLFFLGGVAQIAHEPETAEAEFRIVAAGPFASLVLSFLYYLAGAWIIKNTAIRGVCMYLFQINLILALFNLLPGFPLDGGRLLRAILWKLNQNFERATLWATYSGLGMAGLFVIGGLFLLIENNLIGGIWLAIVGWYLGRAALVHYSYTIGQSLPVGSILRKRLFGGPLPRTQGGAPAYDIGTAMVLSEASNNKPEMTVESLEKDISDLYTGK